ncbi:MAG: hypothetical protein U5L09_03105 [Bacteroidales bacterium]|nr:hypothetical protein [Bacteroidales bacterium]
MSTRVDSTYEVKLVVQTTGGCTDSIVSSVEVRPVPEAWFTYDTTACQGGQVQFTILPTATTAR